jgi:glycosyltransferase involved in cell wall biosynthesis
MAERSNGPRPPLLVFADDWGRHPSSCQHLVRRLLDRHAVCWVNTIGMRPPRLDWATVRRGLEKVRHWISRPAGGMPLPANLRVLNPRMWPWFTRPFDRALNRELLLRQLRRVTATFPVPPVAVTTLPIVADLMGLLPVRYWVYYCVDDFGAWPGLDRAALRVLEERLIRHADRLLAVSESLQEKLARLGRAAPLLSHGVDLEHWSGPAADEPLAELAGLERPLVVFWGLVDRRLDTAWVRLLAAGLNRGTVVLVGPEADPDPELAALRRVARVPAVPFERLPALARAAAVLVMPYADLPVTRASQPLKLKEYLATGLPVVARALPAHAPWADCLDLAETAEEFVQAVRQRLATGLPAGQAAGRRRLAEESWEAKARLFEQWALSDEAARVAAEELRV